LEPNSTVRAVGDLKLDNPQPTRQQLQIDTKTKNEILPFTAYTIFRNVSVPGGAVVTGWSYSLTDTTRPRGQYCYYTKKIDSGIAAKYTLAFDGHPQPPSAAAKLPIPFDEAVANCIWFSGA
jgi:hypothetical protein